MLETLYKYTPDNFYVFVIDQTGSLEAQKNNEHLTHLWIRPYRNLGFAKACNTGIMLSQTPYVTVLNDDVEFLDNRWWQGIEDTFAMDEKIVVVNPNSPKEGAWGYGLTQENKETWQPRKGFAFDGNRSVIPVINDLIIDTPEIARAHYDDLLNKHPVWQKDTLCDALACWCTVFKRETLLNIALFDEHFYPAGGEDYSMMAEIYSRGLRAVGTTKSWAWHHWGASKDDMSGKNPENKLFESRPRWNALEEIWGNEFDVWGKDRSGKPLKRLVPLYIDDL